MSKPSFSSDPRSWTLASVADTFVARAWSEGGAGRPSRRARSGWRSPAGCRWSPSSCRPSLRPGPPANRAPASPDCPPPCRVPPATAGRRRAPRGIHALLDLGLDCRKRVCSRRLDLLPDVRCGLLDLVLPVADGRADVAGPVFLRGWLAPATARGGDREHRKEKGIAPRRFTRRSLSRRNRGGSSFKRQAPVLGR